MVINVESFSFYFLAEASNVTRALFAPERAEGLTTIILDRVGNVRRIRGRDERGGFSAGGDQEVLVWQPCLVHAPLCGLSVWRRLAPRAQAGKGAVCSPTHFESRTKRHSASTNTLSHQTATALAVHLARPPHFDIPVTPRANSLIFATLAATSAPQETVEDDAEAVCNANRWMYSLL